MHINVNISKDKKVIPGNYLHVSRRCRFLVSEIFLY